MSETSDVRSDIASLSEQANIRPEERNTQAWAKAVREAGVNAVLAAQVGELRETGKARLVRYGLPRNKEARDSFDKHWWAPDWLLAAVHDEHSTRYLVNLLPPAGQDLKRHTRRDLDVHGVRQFLLQNWRLRGQGYDLSIASIRPSDKTKYSGDITVDPYGNILMGMGKGNSQGLVALGIENSQYLMHTDDQGIPRYAIQSVKIDTDGEEYFSFEGAYDDTPENQRVRAAMYSVVCQLHDLAPCQTPDEFEHGYRRRPTSIHPGYYEFTQSIDGELLFYDMKDNPAFSGFTNTEEQRLIRIENEFPTTKPV